MTIDGIIQQWITNPNAALALALSPKARRAILEDVQFLIERVQQEHAKSAKIEADRIWLRGLVAYEGRENVYCRERIRRLERVQKAAAVIAAENPNVGEMDWMEFYAAVEQALSDSASDSSGAIASTANGEIRDVRS